MSGNRDHDGLRPEHEYHNLGNDHYKLGEFHKAIELYDKALELHPDLLETHFNRGLAYTRLQQYDRAEKDLRKVIELDPDLAEAYYTQGLILEYDHRFLPALSVYATALEKDPRYEKPLKQIPVAYSNLRAQGPPEDVEQAAECIGRAKQALSDPARRTYLAGKVSHCEGKYRDAVEAFLECKAAGYPEGKRILSDLADAYEGLEDWENAIGCLTNAAQIDTEDPAVQFDLGYALAKIDDHQGAVDAYQRGLASGKEAPGWVLVNIGCAMQNLHRLREAKRYFRQALALTPDDAIAKYNLIEVEILEGRRIESVLEDAGEFFSQHPEEVSLKKELATALLAAGHGEAAIGILAEYVREKPDDVDGRLLRARALARTGKMRLAEKIYREVAEKADVREAIGLLVREMVYMRGEIHVASTTRTPPPQPDMLPENRYCPIMGHACRRAPVPPGNNVVFLGYPHKPAAFPRAVRKIAGSLKKRNCRVIDWAQQEAKRSGEWFCKNVCCHILDSAIAAIEVTDANPNTLFELGLAAAFGRSIFPLFTQTLSSRQEIKPEVLNTLQWLDSLEPEQAAETIASATARPWRQALYGDVTFHQGCCNLSAAEREEDHDGVLIVTPNNEFLSDVVEQHLQPAIRATGRLHVKEVLHNERTIHLLHKPVLQNRYVIALLTPSDLENHEEFNAFVYFVSGLACGHGKRLLILRTRPVQKKYPDFYQNTCDFDRSDDVSDVARQAVARITKTD